VNRKCIICTRDKEVSHFNEEHVFPAAIGGSITIPIICKECNTNLGKKVDLPLTNNNVILHYRNSFQIARSEEGDIRNIKNPLKGLYHTEKGAKYRVEYKNGRPVPIPIRDFNIEYSEERMGYIAKINLPTTDLPNLDAIVRETVRRKGYKIDGYTIESKQENKMPDNLNVMMEIESNSFILGCVKIAYEMTCSMFPMYLTDPVSFLIRKSLKKGKLDFHLTKILKKGEKLNKHFEDKFSKIQGLKYHHHCIMMEVVPKHGLICAVRLFNLIFPVTLSTTFLPIKDEYEFFVYNDALNKTGGSNVFQEFPVIHITMELLGIPANIKENILSHKEGYFNDSNGKISVYTKSEEMMYNDLDLLCNDLIREESTKNFFVQVGIKYDVSNKEYYLKTPEGELVKILDITPERKISLRKTVANYQYKKRLIK
jgi:hypothetical protein